MQARDIQEKVKRKSQEIARLERKLSLEKIKRRKAETRKKIEFGGLVIKAKLCGLSKAVILGALISAEEELSRDPSTKTLFQLKGEAAFLGFEEDEYNK